MGGSRSYTAGVYMKGRLGGASRGQAWGLWLQKRSVPQVHGETSDKSVTAAGSQERGQERRRKTIPPPHSSEPGRRSQALN